MHFPQPTSILFALLFASPAIAQPHDSRATDAICSDAENLDRIPVPDDCASFVICFDGLASYHTCPPGLLYNDIVKACDYASEVVCDATNTNTNTNTKSKSKRTSTDFCSGQADGDYINPASCRTYYHCDAGATALRICPLGENFDRTTKVCLPRYTQCTAPPPDSVICQAGDGRYPNPMDCETFYHCENGVAYFKMCPALLEWNAELETCDWPGQSGCSDGDVTDEGLLKGR